MFVLITLSDYISQKFLGNTISKYLIFILAAALPFCSFSSCLNGYFMGIKKITPLIISQVLETILQICITFYFYYINYLTDTNKICFALIISLLTSDICSFLYLVYEYKKTLKRLLYNTRSKNNYITEICKTSLPVAITTYIKTGLSALKNSLIPLAFVAYGLSYNDSLSYYGIISSTVMSLILFPFTFIQAYCNLLIPELSALNAIKSKNKIFTITKKSLKLTFIFSLIITAILILGSDFINEQFYESLSISLYIKALSPLVIYIYLDNVIDSILKSLNLQTYVMIINVIDLLLSIIFIKFFIPLYGLVAYIFILYFSEIFNFLLSLYILNRSKKKMN